LALGAFRHRWKAVDGEQLVGQRVDKGRLGGKHRVEETGVLESMTLGSQMNDDAVGAEGSIAVREDLEARRYLAFGIHHLVNNTGLRLLQQ
jgi:hypothetical protein